MSHATTPTEGLSTVDCEVLTDIHTQSNLAEVEVVSLVQELIPRYRLRAETDFAASDEDFIQTPRIDGSEFQVLTNPQIRALLDYYATSSDRISQMTKTYHDISAVTRMLEERENDLQMAVTLGQNLLESNGTLRAQMTILEKDIEQTTDLVKQLKHDLLLKERLIRFYSDLEELDEQTIQTHQIDTQHYEQKIRNLEFENEELRAETIQLKLDAEAYEQQEQAIVDNFSNELATANAEIDQLQERLAKKTDENNKQSDELLRLIYEMRDIRHQLNELRKENEELKALLSISGKNRQEYENKLQRLEKNYSECLEKLHQSQQEINSLQQKFLNLSPSSSNPDLSSQRQTVFLSPVEYANFMGIEHSLKSELEEVLEDPNQLCPSTMTVIEPMRKVFRRRTKRDPSDTDGESTVNDSAFSDTESLSSASSCPRCQRCPSEPKSSSSSMIDRRRPYGLSSKLMLVKRFEGSMLLKRWQQLAEPSLSSCLQTIPGVYTRAEILHDIAEEQEKPDRVSTLLDYSTIVPDPDDDNDKEATTPPSSPIHAIGQQTNALLQQVMQRLVGLSVRTFQTIASSLVHSNGDDDDDDEKEDTEEEMINTNAEQRFRRAITITPPSSPTFEGPIVPTPNTALRAIRSSTFLRVSSLNPIAKAFAIRSPGEIPTFVNDFLRTHPSRT